MSSTAIINGIGVKGTIKLSTSPFTEYELEAGVEKSITDYGKYTVTINALDGYKLNKVEIYDIKWRTWKPMIINENKTVATYDNTVNVNNNYYIKINVETTGDGVPEITFLSFNNLYLINYDILKAISEEDMMISWGSSAGGSSVIDLRNFIISVLEFNFSISDKMIGESSVIKLGNYSLKTVAPTLKVDEITLDLGVIKVPEKYFNSYDYLNTKININLPFLESIELEKEYVIGYEIGIKYNIDLFKGNSTVIITSSKTKKIIYSSNFILGREIPFASTASNVVNSLSEVRGLRNDIKTPYIEVIRNVIPNMQKFNNAVTKQGTLENVKGYISINEIDLKVETNSIEKESIISILKQGVTIK